MSNSKLGGKRMPDIVDKIESTLEDHLHRQDERIRDLLNASVKLGFSKLKTYDVVRLKGGQFGTVVYIYFPMKPNNIRVLLWNSGSEKLFSFSDFKEVFKLNKVYEVI